VRVELFASLDRYVHAALEAFDRIGPERRTRLEELARFIQDAGEANRPARLIFICTHNSRRSHLAQIWAQTAAAVYELDHVMTYSGGTEATAFDPRAIAALRRAGFAMEIVRPGDNPVVRARLGPDAPAMDAFSKSYDDEPNPTRGFCAVMTCSAADADCPVVHGAALRISLPYEDPKAFDGTPRETDVYDERCLQIGTEMLYALSRTRG
jgi:hypothetical protein